MKQRVLLAVLTAMLFYSCGTTANKSKISAEMALEGLFDYLDKKQ